MSATSIVMPGGFCAIAMRNAAMLYEPLRRLPQMARTLIPPASLITNLHDWTCPRSRSLIAALGRGQASCRRTSCGPRFPALLLRRAHLLEFDEQEDVVDALDDATDQKRPAECRQGQ